MIKKSQTYSKLKNKINEMSQGQKINKLNNLAAEIFIIANSFAKNRMGPVAVYLHESVNNIYCAQKIIDGKIENKISLDFVKSNFFIK